MRREFQGAKRWVVKVGTSSLNTKDGRFSLDQLEAIAAQAAVLIHKNIQVVLVSSGAIALGMDTLKRTRRPTLLSELQACAAIGQGKLMGAYETAFLRRGLHAAQVLLTRDEFQSRSRYVSAKHTIETLLRLGAVPVVNENDTVATEEIKFGDNDILSVHVAHLINANLLIFLSDIDGFYLKDKTILRQIRSLEELKHYMGHIHEKRSEKTAGGMKAKFQAAQLAMRLGIPIVLANGRDEDVMERVLRGEEVGSLFCPSPEKLNARKKWLAHAALCKGCITVDAGAREVLMSKNRSLLASGIVSASGHFDLGDPVEISDSNGEVFARGLVNYSCDEVEKIKSRKTNAIASVLGYKRCDEIVHRNNLVILASS